MKQEKVRERPRGKEAWRLGWQVRDAGGHRAERGGGQGGHLVFLLNADEKAWRGGEGDAVMLGLKQKARQLCSCEHRACDGELGAQPGGTGKKWRLGGPAALVEGPARCTG